MILELPALTDEYVRVRVSATEDGVTVNPTSDTVELAFMTSGSPGVSDWLTGEWETDATTNPDTYYARTRTLALAPGSYDVWVRVHDSPETVVRKAGPMILF
jgi:hypothetical protein